MASLLLGQNSQLYGHNATFKVGTLNSHVVKAKHVIEAYEPLFVLRRFEKELHSLKTATFYSLKQLRIRAKKRAAKAFKRNFEKGFVAGLEQGYATIKVIEDEIAEQAKSYQTLLAKDAMNLTFEIAEKVLEDSILKKPSSILKRISGSLNMLPKDNVLHIEVNPKDAEIIRKEEVYGEFSLSLQENTKIARGDAKIHTLLGIINCSIKHRFDSIKEEAQG